MIKLGNNAMLRDPNSREFLDVEGLIDLTHELNLDVVDFQLNRGFRSTDPEYLRHIKYKCHRYGLPIGNVGIGTGFIGRSTGPDGSAVAVPLSDQALENELDVVKEAVDAAVCLGAPLIRLFAGSVPESSENADRQWRSTVSSFQEVADYAVERGILIGLHNHPPAVAPTGDEILRLFSDIDRENVTIILDTGQWWGSPGSNREGQSEPDVDFYRFMEQTAPHASYVRAKIYKIDSGEEEWIDYRRIMPILKAVNYNGIMSIVFEDRENKCGYKESIGLAVKYLRRLLAEYF